MFHLHSPRESGSLCATSAANGMLKIVYFQLLLPTNSFYWRNPDELDWLVCVTIYDSPNCANRNVETFIVNILAVVFVD